MMLCMLQGQLLQLQLPQEVKPDQSTAQRAATTGRLLLRMPKETPTDPSIDLACCRCGKQYLLRLLPACICQLHSC